MAESIEQLSFELTASALAEQERALSGLRTRAGTVLAAVAGQSSAELPEPRMPSDAKETIHQRRKGPHVRHSGLASICVLAKFRTTSDVRGDCYANWFDPALIG